MALRAYFLDPEEGLKQDLDRERISRALASRKGLLWVDIDGLTEGDARFLRETFNFHHLALQDCLDTRVGSPRVVDFEQYLFIVLHGIDYQSQSNIVQTAELDVFVGSRFVVTTRLTSMYSVDGIFRQVAEGQGRMMRRGPDFLTHAVIDALVVNIVPTLDRLANRIDEIEEGIFQRPDRSTLEAILNIKRSILRLQRAMTPQQEALGRLSHAEFDQITQEAELFYRDVQARVSRIEGRIEGLRDRSDTNLAAYLSAMAHQQSESMRTLTTVTAIFLPLTLLAGIYGMNFENMPELGWRGGYFSVLGFMVVVAAGAVWWLWIRRWLSTRRRRPPSFVPTDVDHKKLFGHLFHKAKGSRTVDFGY
jgi:magnesium transporter